MSGASPPPAGNSGPPGRAFPVRARTLLKVRAIWIFPLILGSAVVVLITTFYLATSVLQPALEAASRQIGRQLVACVPACASSPLRQAFLADRVTLTSASYRSLSSHAALGLSAS